MKLKKNYWVFITVFIFALDRLTKTLVLQNMDLEQPINIWPIFNLFFTFNTGAAFSFLNQADGWQGWLFSGIAIAVSIALVIWQFKIDSQHNRLKIALALVLGGTLGNLYDRIIYHSVIDFFDFYFRQWHYPTFNLADSAICIGALMLIIDVFYNKEKKAA
jgi:signal peptidase II